MYFNVRKYEMTQKMKLGYKSFQQYYIVILTLETGCQVRNFKDVHISKINKIRSAF